VCALPDCDNGFLGDGTPRPVSHLTPFFSEGVFPGQKILDLLKRLRYMGSWVALHWQFH
jgi:hypothetical protein